MPIEVIMCFSTSVVTLIFGEFVKRCEIIESNKIPLQNLLIGIIAGFITYCLGFYDNILIAILVCFSGAMTAGGSYDLSKTDCIINLFNKKGDDNEKIIK